MRIEPETVHSARAVVTWSIRLLGVFLIVWGSYLIVQRVVFGVNVGDIASAWRIYDGIGNTHRVSRGIASLVMGTLLAFGGRYLAAWAIVVPERGCPRCGYAGGSTDTCPECGLTGLEREHARDDGSR